MAAATPLHGLTFLNTREARSAPMLTAPLVELGAEVIECPTIALVAPPSWAPFDNRLARITGDDWIVFSSANAVRATLHRIWDLNQPMGVLKRARLACIGKATAAALEDEGLHPDVVPEAYQQEALLAALLKVVNRRDKVWIPRAQEAREHMENGLRAEGIEVTVTPVYRTVKPPGGLAPAREALLASRVDWLTFTSTSTVAHFVDLMDDKLYTHMRTRWPKVACIGAVTAQSAQRHGLPVTVVPVRQDVSGMVAAIVAHVTGVSVDEAIHEDYLDEE